MTKLHIQRGLDGKPREFLFSGERKKPKKYSEGKELFSLIDKTDEVS